MGSLSGVSNLLRGVTYIQPGQLRLLPGRRRALAKQAARDRWIRGTPFGSAERVPLPSKKLEIDGFERRRSVQQNECPCLARSSRSMDSRDAVRFSRTSALA